MIIELQHRNKSRKIESDDFPCTNPDGRCDKHFPENDCPGCARFRRAIETMMLELGMVQDD